MDGVILENQHGVKIAKSLKLTGHYGAANATCSCREELIIAPTIFNAKHKENAPVMVFGDFGVHIATDFQS